MKILEKIKFSTAVQNLKRHAWRLVSAIAALGLFVSPSPISIIMVTVVFAAVAAVAAFDTAEPSAERGRHVRPVSILLTAMIACMGLDAFHDAWAQFDQVTIWADAVGMTAPRLLLMIGAVICAAGLYAMYTLSRWIVSRYIRLLKRYLPVQERSMRAVNLKRNWFFPISAMAFFGLNAIRSGSYMLGLPIVFFAALVFSSQFPSLWGRTKECGPVLRLISALTAVGTCLGAQQPFCEIWNTSSKMKALKALIPAVDIVWVLSILCAVVAVFFVYFCVLEFWRIMIKVTSEAGLFRGIERKEWMVYGLLLAATVGFMCFAFARTQAFYGTDQSYDIIYTSDSPSLVKGNAYLVLMHPENDLRQPLFAVFAAPFIGLPYLAARLIGAAASVRAMLVNGAQVVMLFAANLMLARMMKLDPIKRICFMVLLSCTYTQMLFTLMMEQYIVAYFWLIFCMYLIVEKQHPDRIALWGAGGTLLTSMALLPSMSARSPVKDFKAWLTDMVDHGLEFVAFMLAFSRFDVLFNLVEKITGFTNFSGYNLPMGEKILQYADFVSACFAAPNAGAIMTDAGYGFWRLNAPTAINCAGVLFLLIAAVSAVWNRDKQSSRLAAGWIGYSAVMLLILGWGTKENGLILYTLYFGWSFRALLFQLVEKIESRLKVRFLVPAFTVGTAAAMLVINIPAIVEMVNFVIACYPA